MSRLVTIATFNHSSEYAVLQSHLASEGIESYAQNATTGDILNIYGWEASKIKLQVSEEDYGRSIQLLREHGFVTKSENSDRPAYLSNPLLKKLPFIKNLPPALGFLLLAAVVITFIVVVLYFTVLSE